MNTPMEHRSEPLSIPRAQTRLGQPGKLLYVPLLSVVLLARPSLAATQPPASVLPAPGTAAPLPAPGIPAPSNGFSPLPSIPLTPAEKPLESSPKLEDVARELSGRPLTINEAVSVALATNRTLATAAANLYRAQGRTGEMRAQFNPVLGVGVGDIYQNSSLQPAATIGATMPWDISGLLRAATSQAQFQEVAARLEVNRARNQVIGDVKTAFYRVLRAKALVAVATDDLQNSLDRLKDANLRYEARAVAYIDVVRAQTDVANARRQVIEARNAVSLTSAALGNAMGIVGTSSLQTSDQGAVELPPGVPPPPSHRAPSLCKTTLIRRGHRCWS